MNLRPPSMTVSAHTSAFNAVAFQSSPVMPNAPMSLYTQSVHSLSLPPRPFRTAPSRFPNTIRFGSRPPLIRMSVPAHEKSLLVRNVVSMLSRRVIMSRARLHEEPFNDWGGRGCRKFVPVSKGDGTKIAPPGDIFDQPPGEMS